MNFTDQKTYNDAKENLLVAKQILDSLGVKFFLGNGTLLGCMRDHDFIPHDVDVDIGVRIGDARVAILDDFKNAGFDVYGIFGYVHNGFQYSLKRHGIKLDIFFYYDEGEQTTMSVWQGDKQIKYRYSKIDKFAWVNFMGDWFRIPTDYEKYLTEQYGDWRTPVPNWDWATSPKNINND